MRFFQRKEGKSRTIEDILTPRERSAEELSEDADAKCENDTEETAGADIKQVLTEQDDNETAMEKALKCFGWKESKTEKWLAKSASVWYAIMSGLWFIFGAMTFAPVIFIRQKIDVVFHDKKKSFLVAGCIYLVAILTLVLVIVL